TMSGVAGTFFRAWREGGPTPSTVRGTLINIPTPGNWTVEYWSTDRAGRTEAVHQQRLTVATTPPRPAFTMAPLAALTQEPFTFTDRSSDIDGSIASQRWIFDDGTVASGPS